MTTLERMADVLEPFVTWQDPDRRGTALMMARLALKAIREPSKEMIEPGYTAMDEAVDFYNYDSGAGYFIEPSGPADVWRAMIDAALSDAENGQ